MYSGEYDEEAYRRDHEERDKCFAQTLEKARQQSAAIKAMLDEEQHASQRDDMRSAYLTHGTEFDPCQIQEPTGPTQNLQALGGAPKTTRTWNMLLDLEQHLRDAHADISGQADQLVGGVHPPPKMTASQKSLSEMLQMSPPRGGQTVPQPMQGQYDPNLWFNPPQTRKLIEPQPPPSPDHDLSTMSPDLRALLERVKKTVSKAYDSLNLETPPAAASSPHPLSYSFSSGPSTTQQLPQIRKPLADLYSNPVAGPSNEACPEPSSQGPSFTPYYDSPLQTRHDPPPPPPPPQSPYTPPAAPPVCPDPDDILSDPRLQFRSRLPATQSGPSPRSASTSGGSRSPVCPPTSIPTPRSTSAPPHRLGGDRTRGPAQPQASTSQESIKRAVAAGKFKGTQAEMETLGYHGTEGPREMWEQEFGFVDKYITSYKGPPPEIEESTPGHPGKGLLMPPPDERTSRPGPKRRIMLKRKVVMITIPPRPAEPGEEDLPGMSTTQYTFQEGDPQYSIRQGALLPPRRLTPSPVRQYNETMRPRTPEQLQSRRDLEADWERRQGAVASRPDGKRDVKKPLPKAFTTGQKKPQYYRGGAPSTTQAEPTASTSFGMAYGGRGRPETPTTRTGLVLRQPGTPSTPTSSRSGSAPPMGRGRGGPVGPCRGRPTSAGGRGGRGGGGGGGHSPAPTMAGSYIDQIQDVTGVNISGGGIPLRTQGIPDRIEEAAHNMAHHISDMVDTGRGMVEDVFHDIGNPIDYVHEGMDYARDTAEHYGLDDPVGLVRQGFQRVRERLERLEDLSVRQAVEEAKNQFDGTFHG